MNNGFDITPCNIFISWTGNDSDIKNEIAGALEESGLEVLLSDRKCQGNFVNWSIAAATSASVFMPVITESAFTSQGMEWELSEIEKMLEGACGKEWEERILPLCESLELYEKYDRKGILRKHSISATFMERSEERSLTSKCLEAIASKATLRLSSMFFDMYNSAVRQDYIKLAPIYRRNINDNAEKNALFGDIYIKRTLTEIKDNDEDSALRKSPSVLLSPGKISYIYAPAGAGKSLYITEIFDKRKKDALVITLSCSKVFANREKPLFTLMYEHFHKKCRAYSFYTEQNFTQLLGRVSQLVLIFDGLDEISTVSDTRKFIKLVEEFYALNKEKTTLIFAGRNESDFNHITILNEPVAKFRLNLLSENETKKLGDKLLFQFGCAEKKNEFFLRAKDLKQEIKSNPLLLSQLAFIYRDRGELPSSITGIWDAITEITLKAASQREISSVPAHYREMIESHLGGILKKFSRNFYVKSSKTNETPDFFSILCGVLKSKYKEDRSDTEERCEFLSEYLHNSAIFVDGEFYHKMFLEYFTAVSFYEDIFSYDNELEEDADLEALFANYGDLYWNNVISLFLVKADSVIDSRETSRLYAEILKTGFISDYTLLFDTCRDLIRHREAAQFSLVSEILENSAKGVYAPYGPLFWYVPEYGLYETAILCADAMADERALALVRDVCFISGHKNTVSEITDRVDGAMLYEKAGAKLSGVRKELCELFCTGSINDNVSRDIYPRCFNPAEAVSFLEKGCGIFGRMKTPFSDELGLFSHEMYSEHGGEYIGFISAPYDKETVESRLSEKPTVKVRSFALTPTERITLDYISFTRSSIHTFYLPENILMFSEAPSLHMPLDLSFAENYHGILYFTDTVYYDGKEVTRNMFAGHPCIEKVILTDNVEKIDAEAFSNCHSLKELRLSAKLEKIPWQAFFCCTALTSVVIPENVTEIENSAFSGCINLKKVLIPEKIKKILPYAFSVCPSLKEINIPDGIEEISDTAFEGSDNIKIDLPEKTVYIDELDQFATLKALMPEISDSAITSMLNSAKEYNKQYEEEDDEDENYDSPPSVPYLEIPVGTKQIKDCQYQNFADTISISIPDGVEAIGQNAFYGCSRVEEITLPDSVRIVEEGAFMECSSLKKIRLPNGIKEIPDDIFSDCEKLSEIVIPESITYIGAFAFKNCKSLKEITIPQSTEKIHEFAFSECSSLTEISIPKNVIDIGENAFEGCSSLKKVTLSANFKNSISYIFGDTVPEIIEFI